MLLYHTNKEGYIQAYFEWDVVNENGLADNLGQYMHVRHIWVHPDHNGREEIKKFILELDKHRTNLFVKWIYWIREKDGFEDRPSKMFSRENCLRKAGKYARFFEKVFA